MSSFAAAYDGSHGVAGGKFPKKPLRKSHTKPYDRPLTVTQRTKNNNNNNNNNGWLSKIVDPASMIINAGAQSAHMLFSSVFRSSDEDKEIEYEQPETATNVVDSATKLPASCGGMDYDGYGVAKLEDILKQKTFTRSEIDQLTALLLSRTNENLDGAEKVMSVPKLSDLQAVHACRDKLSTLRGHENNIEHALSGIITTPEVKSKVFPDDVASPAEIAKAYMAGRPTDVSPSVLRLQDQLQKEEVSTPYNSLYKSISPALYLNQKAASNIGTSSNGFMTPRFRGRSIIHMARTPYSRVHPVMSSKAAETNLIIGGGPSYHNVTSHHKKQAIKRRSSVLDYDIGSVGPICRIRQKSNLLHPKTPSLPPPGGRQETHVSGSSVERGSQNRSFSNVLAVNSLPGTSSRYVPSQSIKMAQKIFEHLDKFSPKATKKSDPESLDSLKCSPSSQDVKKSKGSLDYVREHNHAIKTSSIAEELDDNVPSKEMALSTSLIEGRQHAESSAKSVAIPDILLLDQTNTVEKRPDLKPAAQLGKTELESLSNGCSPFERIVRSAPQSTLQYEVAQQNENNNFVITSSSKPDNLPPAVCTPLL